MSGFEDPNGTFSSPLHVELNKSSRMFREMSHARVLMAVTNQKVSINFYNI